MKFNALAEAMELSSCFLAEKLLDLLPRNFVIFSHFNKQQDIYEPPNSSAVILGLLL